MDKSGWPDEEDLVFLPLRVRSNLGRTKFNKTWRSFVGSKVRIQGGCAKSVESGIQTLEGLVSWTYHTQSVLSAAQRTSLLRHLGKRRIVSVERVLLVEENTGSQIESMFCYFTQQFCRIGC